ncbi:hypothetical protein GCM10011584_09280 [Nocardioides phosphati]|uniref:Peptidase M15C domain-containing protein n=1 Tax=Nocardioides phosphati TaxID=1867775 RepID=A0ABQ2N6V2_9ACTN|nr:M15 family metallopeptidase [Nocardioides phosphati]GGO86592.1 hypothetical protein GCM10011584_09280 [Nocardioides phosphati]
MTRYAAILIDKLSGRYDRAPRLLLRQVQASALARDIITLTEVAGWRRRRALRKVPGFTVLQDTKHGDAAEVAMLVRDSVWRVLHWEARVIGPDLGPGGRVIALFAVLEHVDTGLIYLVSDAHLPATVEGQWDSPRAAAYRAAVQQYRVAHNRLAVLYRPGAVDAFADWNLNLHKPRTQQWVAAAWPELKAPTTLPSGGTHAGGRLIDWFIGRGRHVDSWRILPPNPASDHRGIRVTLHAPVKARPPKKEPLMSTSQNHWPALASDSTKLYTWVIPARSGDFTLRLRNGSAGFLLAHYALWFADVVEPVLAKTLDDWGYAYRTVRGYSTTLSNHASGTAMDLNATTHPLGKVGTFKPWQVVKIHARLVLYRGCLRWGGDYTARKDEMHTEINRDLPTCERRARALMTSPRGKRLLAANPTQKAVIES